MVFSQRVYAEIASEQRVCWKTSRFRIVLSSLIPGGNPRGATETIITCNTDQLALLAKNRSAVMTD